MVHRVGPLPAKAEILSRHSVLGGSDPLSFLPCTKTHMRRLEA